MSTRLTCCFYFQHSCVAGWYLQSRPGEGESFPLLFGLSLKLWEQDPPVRLSCAREHLYGEDGSLSLHVAEVVPRAAAWGIRFVDFDPRG